MTTKTYIHSVTSQSLNLEGALHVMRRQDAHVDIDLWIIIFQWASKNYCQLCHDRQFTLFRQLELGSQYGWDCSFNFMEVLELVSVFVPQKKTLSVNF